MRPKSQHSHEIGTCPTGAPVHASAQREQACRPPGATPRGEARRGARNTRVPLGVAQVRPASSGATVKTSIESTEAPMNTTETTTAVQQAKASKVLDPRHHRHGLGCCLRDRVRLTGGWRDSRRRRPACPLSADRRGRLAGRRPWPAWSRAPGPDHQRPRQHRCCHRPRSGRCGGCGGGSRRVRRVGRHQWCRGADRRPAAPCAVRAPVADGACRWCFGHPRLRLLDVGGERQPDGADGRHLRSQRRG